MACQSISKRALRIALPCLLAGLAGADESGAPAVPAASGKTPGRVILATYLCNGGSVVEVRYDNSDPEAPVATLRYKGRAFDLYGVRSGSGARYATEQGLAPDRGLQWWIKGDEATLSEMLLDHTAPEPTVIETCRAKPD